MSEADEVQVWYLLVVWVALFVIIIDFNEEQEAGMCPLPYVEQTYERID